MGILKGEAPLPFGPWWELYRRLTAGGDDFPVVPAALAMGHILQGGQVWPEAEARLRTLEDAAAALAPSGPADHETAARAIAALLAQRGFSGNTARYEDPPNSFLDRVLERRCGLPIALSVLVVHLARHAGVPLRGVGFPGHFVVGLGFDTERPLVLDPFRGGRPLLDDELDALLARATGRLPAPGQWRRYAHPATGRDILMRMLRNLVIHLDHAGQPEHAAAARRLLQLTMPGEALADRPARD